MTDLHAAYIKLYGYPNRQPNNVQIAPLNVSNTASQHTYGGTESIDKEKLLQKLKESRKKKEKKRINIKRSNVH